MLIAILLVIGLLVISVAVIALLCYIAKRRRNLSTEAEYVRKNLPGIDCGMCGEKNCVELAKKIVEGSKKPEECKLIKPEIASRIRQNIKQKEVQTAKLVALVKCKGGKHAEDKYIYSGADNCAIQEKLHSGCKACKFACLGCGDCVKACRYKAIHINDRGTAEVERAKCTGCGACVASCPNGLISMNKLELSVGVICNNQSSEPGIEKKCSVGCTHCGNCIGVCPTNAIDVVDNVPVIDPDKCIECYRCVLACPNHCISRL